jgi:acyl carrier protein
MNDLEEEIKSIIITALSLEDITPQEIDPEAPLFGEGLGLDSIDALELGIAIKKKFNITLSAEDKENQKHFYSVRTLSEFIAKTKV